MTRHTPPPARRCCLKKPADCREESDTPHHRLNFSGNRAVNRTLYMIAIVRLRYCERTRTYLNRRVAEGKTKKEAIRCLKRFIARELYRTLRADLATLTTRT